MIDLQIINTKPLVIELSANSGLASTGVQTVTGIYVNNTDPQNPIVNVAPLEARVSDLENILSSQSNFTGYAYAVWTGVGLVFDVFWPDYYIQGISYPGGTDQVTLATADATYARLDVIAVDATGAIVLTGTPAVDPIKPTIDPLNQLEITTILVAAGATTPSGITHEDVYKENTEWTGTSNNGTVAFNSTADPFAGTVSVECDAFNDTHNIRFTDSVTHDKTDFSVLILSLQLKSTWSGGGVPTYLNVQFVNAGVPVSSIVGITSGSYNFLRSTVGSYQTIVIPISAFTFSDPEFDRIEFTFQGLNPDGFFLDNIILQTGSATVSPLQNGIGSIQTDSGTANADLPEDTFQILGAGTVSTSAVGKVITITGVGGGGSSVSAPLALWGFYKIDTGATSSPVSAGDIAYNNATQASATSLFINELTDGGVDIDVLLSKLDTGAILYIQDKNSAANYQIWEISSTPSFASATWTVPVTLNTSGGTGTTNFPNNHEVFLAVQLLGGGGGGHVIQEEGTPLTQRANLNFVGGTVTATDDSINDATIITITDPSQVDDTAYDATSWNGVTTTAPSKNAVRDKIESLVLSISTAVYDLGDVSGSVSVDLSLSRNFKCRATGNITSFTYTNLTEGVNYIIEITTETSAKTIAFAAGVFSIPLGSVGTPQLTNCTQNGSSPAKAIDLLTLYARSATRLVPVITPDCQDL